MILIGMKNFVTVVKNGSHSTVSQNKKTVAATTLNLVATNALNFVDF